MSQGVGRPEDIAIVGIGCLFPGADSPARFWENVVGGFDAIGDPPPSWRPEVYCDPSGRASEPVYAGKGGYLGDLSRFDPGKYGVMPSSVEGAEPDQFLALRCAADALADAGVPGRPMNREKTGVILGRGAFVNRGQMSWMLHGFVIDQVVGLLGRLEPHRGEAELSTLRDELKRGLPPFNSETMPGLAPCLLSGRIANRLDLKGPAYTLDAACASVLVAVEQAMTLLRSGLCDAMIVGGVQSTPAMVHQLFCQIEALSRTGRIAPFSAESGGTLLGEGCGMLVLKRRGDAERDGDRVYALLKAVGVSSDGRGAGLLAPRTEGQQLALRRSYEQAGLPPSTVALIEAHGTGISLGDQTEVRTLEALFGARRGPVAEVAIGSVKSMIGHLLPASGAASIIKTALALYHRTIPPTLHARQPNPGLGLERSNLYLSTDTRPWIHGDREAPRRAGVDAFGFGGINAHAILEEAPVADESALERLESTWPAELVVVSADDAGSLSARVRSLDDWLDRAEGVRLLDVAASCAEESGSCRLAIVAEGVADLRKKLAHAARLLEQGGRDRIQDRSGIFWYREPLGRSGRVGFVFPGEGAQYVGMLADLCRHFPEVRREFDRTDAAFRRLGSPVPLSRLIFPPAAETAEAEAQLFGLEGAVVSVTAAERALLALLGRLGIRPDAIVGHSSGEFGALLAAGSFRPDDEDALIRSIAEGVENAREVAASGRVAPAVLTAVGGADRAVVERVVAESGGRLVIAMDNCPHQAVLSGDEAATAAALEALRGRGGLCERLPWGRAYHTEAFAPAARITERYVRSLRLGAPKVELWSCATADRFPTDPEAVNELAVRQWRSPVRFRETIEAMYASGVRVFVEVGPRGNLAAFVSDTLGKRSHVAVALDAARKNGLEQLCRAVGMLAAHGLSMDLRSLHRARGPRRLDFRVDPPARPAPQPPLDQTLPGLVVGASAASAWIATDRGVPASATETPPAPPPARPAPADAEPVVVVATQPDVSPIEADPEPTAPAIVAEPAFAGVRERFLGEFQQTMRAFLDVQEQAALVRFGAVPAPHDDSDLPQETEWEDHFAAEAEVQEFPLNVPGISNPTPMVRAVERPPDQTDAPPLAGISTPATEAMPTAPLPFLHDILAREDELLVAECELDIERHRFLRDHTFFGHRISDLDPDLAALPVMPLAMTLELMAEAAVAIRPGMAIAAIRDVRTQRWLAFETPTRRVRMEARAGDDGDIRVVLREADREGMAAEVAEATFEFSAGVPDLGPSVVPDGATTPFPWPQGDVYGRIMFHGPAFRGITAIEAIDPHATRAAVREPDPALIVPEHGGRGLVLPVGLMDVAGQVAGVVVRRTWTESEVQVTFPNTIERLEFAPMREREAALKAVTRVEVTATHVRSDVEMTDESGAVVLRALGRSEELMRLPAELYGYWRRPREAALTRDLAERFRDVPGSDRIALRATAGLGGKLLVNRLWSQALARMVLGADEREALGGMKLPPVPTASWLLGRVAAKDAVRRCAEVSACLADVRIEPDPHGRPVAAIPGGEAPLVSIAHKGFLAVAAAADPRAFAGVGIDLEPLGPMDPGVAADAFDADERARIERAAGRAGEPVETWLLSAWGAKEALGKALGRGVLGGPRSVAIVDVDPDARRFALELRGAMAREFPEAAGAGRVTPFAASTRVSDGHAITLCLLPRGA